MPDVPATLQRLLADRDDGSLAKLCRQHKVDLLVWFGSSRRDPAAAGDVDIAFSFVDADPAGDVLGVVNALLDRYGDAVDVMPLDRASVVARYEALCKGEILVQLTPGKFATQQMGAFGIFCDTQWMRDAQLEALAR